MLQTATIALDVLLLLGLTLRLVRLVVLDDISAWYLRDPLAWWAIRKAPNAQAMPKNEVWPIRMQEPGVLMTNLNTTGGWRAALVSGLSCPWCVGFWIGCATLASLAVAGGPGHAHESWRWVAAAFTLNYVAAHVGPRLGDAGYADEEHTTNG